ncbi:MAG: hypothetical protein R2878_08560 [Thermoleophilia bacterium]
MSNRDDAIGRLLGRALTRPANVLPAAGVIAAGVLTGFWPLYLIGGAVYGVLAATTLFSTDEARRALGRGPRPSATPISDAHRGARFASDWVNLHYRQVLTEYERITEAVDRSPLSLPEITVETRGLMDDVHGLCSRAQTAVDYLESVDREALINERRTVDARRASAGPELRETLDQTVRALDQNLATIAEMRGTLEVFDARMGQLRSNLGAIRGEVARLEVDGHDDEPARVLTHVSSARELVTGITAALEATPDPPPAASREPGLRPDPPGARPSG